MKTNYILICFEIVLIAVDVAFFPSGLLSPVGAALEDDAIVIYILSSAKIVLKNVKIC